MLVEDIVGKTPSIGTHELNIIREQCSQYIEQSGASPLYRLLPLTYENFEKVKVRKKDKQDIITTTYNKAFEQHFYNLRQRAVFAYPHVINENMTTEPFYIFPINGFKFLYSKEVKNSNEDYQQVINTLFEKFNNTQQAVEIVTDLLKYTYCCDKLTEGINSNSEIIIYNIPFYYAIRAEKFPNYIKIISS